MSTQCLVRPLSQVFVVLKRLISANALYLSMNGLDGCREQIQCMAILRRPHLLILAVMDLPVQVHNRRTIKAGHRYGFGPPATSRRLRSTSNHLTCGGSKMLAKDTIHGLAILLVPE